MRFKEPNKRYYFELQRKTRSFRVDLPKRKWCDLWHQHFDWEGFGDRGWVHRRRHLSALLVALSRARNELALSSQPYQLFAVVHVSDAGSDAIYVHTENPNGTEFPLSHSGRVLQSLPPLLAGRVDLNKYRVFSQHEGKEHCYVIEPK
jgi:hypothetical protein